jgi:hypothetical protein
MGKILEDFLNVPIEHTFGDKTYKFRQLTVQDFANAWSWAKSKAQTEQRDFILTIEDKDTKNEMLSQLMLNGPSPHIVGQRLMSLEGKLYSLWLSAIRCKGQERLTFAQLCELIPIADQEVVFELVDKLSGGDEETDKQLPPENPEPVPDSGAISD